MSSSKILGFFDFHITAEKTRDFFLSNDFESKNLIITPVTSGQKFGEVAENINKQAPAIITELDHHTIISFFKHLFTFEGKKIDASLPYISDRDGFILTVISGSSEETQIAKEALNSHGAWFVKEM